MTQQELEYQALLQGELATVRLENARLRAALVSGLLAAERDAARYRWLRNGNHMLPDDEELDRQIDKAMKEKP